MMLVEFRDRGGTSLSFGMIDEKPRPGEQLFHVHKNKAGLAEKVTIYTVQGIAYELMETERGIGKYRPIIICHE